MGWPWGEGGRVEVGEVLEVGGRRERVVGGREEEAYMGFWERW
jgi:hypothetical protein